MIYLASVAFAVVVTLVFFRSRIKVKLLLRRLSWPAKEIAMAYYLLPPENRPINDIVPVLRAMDVKYDRKMADDHFMSVYGGYQIGPHYITYAWHDRYHPCGHQGCPFKEYSLMYDSIKDIEKALKRQRHLIKVEGVQAALDMAKDLTDRLRDEQTIINSVTDDFVTERQL